VIILNLIIILNATKDNKEYKENEKILFSITLQSAYDPFANRVESEFFSIHLYFF
jgi:hypothetical protein